MGGGRGQLSVNRINALNIEVFEKFDKIWIVDRVEYDKAGINRDHAILGFYIYSVGVFQSDW